MSRDTAIAWVESPLQLVGAAEWAHATGHRVPVAGRLTAQMSSTADELNARGAAFSTMAPYLGIPFALLAEHTHWLVGDGFSGQFRLAAALLRPRKITLLDDGANTMPLADSLLGLRRYSRPGVSERGLTTKVAPFALEHVLRAARRHRVELFTCFDLGAERTDALQDRGFGIRRHSFEWTRSTASAMEDIGPRVILGSAGITDGRMPLDAYLRWVAAAAGSQGAAYLPHRRERSEQLDAVRAVPGVRVVTPGIPVELVLAGARSPLEIITLPSSTVTTLPLVLAGTGSVIRDRSTSASDRGVG